MSPIGTIKSTPKNPRLAKALIAAAYHGLEFNVQDFDLNKDRTPDFLNKFPLGKIPVFESDQVNLFESSAIGYYAASLKPDSDLLGKNAIEKALVIQWTLFSETEITRPLAHWLPVVSAGAPYIKPNFDAAVNDVKRALGALDKILLTKTYLIGDRVTYADIAIVANLVIVYTLMLDKPARAEFKNVTRYFTTVAAQPHFKQVLGDLVLCETPLTPPKKEAKKETPKKKEEEAPKKELVEEPKPAPKPKSKLDLLPPSPFVMDAWKREYSNNDTKDAIKWFWEHFDPEGYSIWKVDYKYNDELTLTFMSNNLIGGFYARLERAHKYAFGSMIVRGENNNNSISGYFVIRGQEVPYEIYDAADYESYNFQKIEPSQYEEKKEEFYKYLAWDFEDCVDGKVFK
ncbi:uncharacterized protein B0P05DRAFT_550550 [Gilbertella persicaria]|uniref:uncharacterized protein n=1 Tax=Gilbertella persicaria TaxID=101096 RepID=UPI0022202B5C|nr:uncharacterized protein B0P05DRAFT_550550 [Gilbertella persicaria]KAI8070646.1 hypothetical protein B0P05DRAFT_550550 [Gilbertella persicaria]